MKINIEEITVKIKLMSNDKYPDIKAQAFLSFVDDKKRSMTISGFTVRNSKYENGGFYVTPPSRGFFKFFLAETSLWKEIEREMINKYNRESIPVVEDRPTIVRGNDPLL